MCKIFEVSFHSRIAVISAVLDEPEKCQQDFNSILANFKEIIKAEWVFL